MESFISEGKPENDNNPRSKNGVPTSLPFFKKALPWCVIGVFAIIAVVFIRVSIPPMEYLEDVAIVSIPRFVALIFQLAWFVLFFAILRKIPFWGSGIVFAIFFLPAALSIYLRKFYGVEINPRLVIDCINTHWEEAQAFFSLHAVSILLGFIALMFAVAWGLRKTPAKLPHSKILVAVLVFVLVFFANLPNLRVYIFPVKITLGAVHSLRWYYAANKHMELEQLAELEGKPQEVLLVPSEISHVNSVPIVVLHIGETARADHAPFNGYARNTMPNMLREYEAGNLVSFPKCVSFSTQTPVSMRGILSPSTVLDNEFRYPTFIPALNQSKIRTCAFCSSFGSKNAWNTWVGRQLGGMQDLVCTAKPALSLLPEIRETCASDAHKIPPQKRFYLYYGEGSHEPFISYDYDRHAVFKPNGKRKYADERDVNNYDNTFIAVDEFCAGFIDVLRDENAVYIFVGDHGEMLGEDGLQGRPFRRKEVRHVLFFVWVSEKFKKENPKLWETLLHNHDRLGIVSHDFVYNSVLHLFSLKTPFYDDKADLFSNSAEPFPTEMPDSEKFRFSL